MPLVPKLPIGVFDSGVGGLTVARALIRQLPFENIIYFGDTARVPYGIKSAQTITQYAAQITQFLLEKQVKLLIVACNTMAAVASEAIKSLSPVPVLDVIAAGADSAASATHSGRIGVIGTLTTVNSNAYVHAIGTLNPRIQVYSRACPLFVPLVEEGWLDHAVTRLTAIEYLRPLLAENIDTLVLGCTHYPLLQPLLQEVAGPSVHLVDSANNVAHRAGLLLHEQGLMNPDRNKPKYEFYVTDVPLRFQAIGERFLGTPLSNISVVAW